MKVETIENKLKEMQKARKSINPRFVHKIEEAKEQEKALKAKIKAKKESEEKLKSEPTPEPKKRVKKKDNSSRNIEQKLQDVKIKGQVLLQRGEKLDSKNQNKYQNLSVEELKKELENKLKPAIYETQEDFENWNSEVLVLQKLIKQKEKS